MKETTNLSTERRLKRSIDNIAQIKEIREMGRKKRPANGDTIVFDEETGDRIRDMWNTMDDGFVVETRWIITRVIYKGLDQNPIYTIDIDRKYRLRHAEYIKNYDLHKEIRKLKEELARFITGEIRGAGCSCD